MEATSAEADTDAVFRAIVETAPLAVAIHVDGTIVYANRSAEEALGVPPGGAEGLAVRDLVHPDFREVVRHRDLELRRGRPLPGSLELAVVRPDGMVLQVEAVSSLVDVGGRPGVCVMACDVTERVRREAHFAHLATHDGLTGLPNRLLLLDRLDQALARVGRGCEAVLVLFLDLDGFKKVNDDHGHAVGDALLQQVAERVRAGVRAMDTVARLAGDEFVVVAELESLDLADVLCERLERALTEPYAVAGQEVTLGASAGALVVDHPGSGHDVLVEADRRMYAAKQSRRRGNSA